MKQWIRNITQYPLTRIVIVVMVTAATLFLVGQSSWLWAAISFVALCYSIRWTIRLYTSQTRKVIYMLEALENNDTASRFSKDEGTWTDRTINAMINKVSLILNDAKSETIQKEKYYELILSCINTGIFVLNDSGYVHQKNEEVLKLFGLEVFTHIQQLERTDPTLVQKISSAAPGDNLQLSFHNERGSIQLSVRVSGIQIKDEHLRIFTLNDINNELDEKELDSWIRLIRVLTHEIMNSVTPITSLSDTLLSMSASSDREIRNGLQTISTTGKGLLSFVESYRKFTRIPTPEPTLFYIKTFIERMVELARHQVKYNNINFETNITPPELILYADENLVTQVMLNLLKNSIQAIGSAVNGKIIIRAYCNKQDQIFIEVSNNGPQIEQEVAEQIFIPFFTTKESGNGIGLSLSRQIMRVSGGSLKLMPYTNNLTTFRLKFK